MENGTEETIDRIIREHQQNKKLVSSELGELFANYQGDSVYNCVFCYFLDIIEDDEIRNFISMSQSISQKHLHQIKVIFKQEGIPIPSAFGDQDIRMGSPRLFSDIFMVFYTTEMARAAFAAYGSALGTSYRHDVITYFEMCLKDTKEVYKKGIALLMAKGFDITSPEIPYPQKVDFVEKESFISIVMGKSRPLLALEIKHLQKNIYTNAHGKALMLGFSQVASSEKLRNFFREGSQLADKQIRELSTFLLREDLPSPRVLDDQVTDSTSSPFSDRLMLTHASMASATGIMNYGAALSKILRHDIHAQFISLTAGVGKYADEGLTMMISNGWLEEPPTAADRKKLSERSAGKKT
ncbi:DUF3231 family protein [Rossellomorea vietnamensis]|uniref:DUF3231 family protein n=1 Tax=Rossellomorea vietnamensis TaxID=218284 RepID=UPI003CEC8654